MPATQPATNRLAATLIAAACAVLLAGCATSLTGSAPPSEDRAERALRQGNPAAAAEMFERLAEGNPPPDRNDFAFRAARAWLQANRADDAQRALELAAPQFTPAQQFEQSLVRAEVGVARGQYAAAWQSVAAIPEPANAGDASRLFHLRQEVALRAGRPVDAVRAGIARERVAAEGADRVRRDLLTDLRGAIERGLRVEPAASDEPLVRGWLEIAEVAVSASRSPLSADASVARWRGRYPAHPATTILESEILRRGERPGDVGAPFRTGGPVALLLPLSAGQYTGVAALVRDGFQAALSRLPEIDRPELRIYDTGAQPVAAALQAAQAEGATFIVGPLTPEEVRDAALQRPAGVPLLLLNTLRGDSYAGGLTYQYALSPEDEARQIARQIAGSGRRRAAVLAPAGDWGARVATAFADELARAGGAVIAQAGYNYDRARNDLADKVTVLLGINQGRDRHRRVQQVTGATLEYEPRPRPDIEAIFVAGYDPQAVRQINPLLRFYNAGEVPTYITQDAVDSAVAGNRDLEGMWVLDTPWALDSVGQVADLRAATESSWRTAGARQSRFFAFGYDAATLAVALRRGATNWPIAGLTGRLQPTPEGRIERSLNWGRLREGQVLAFDPVSN